MRRLLEDVIESGDVLELESAIIEAQNIIVTSANPREENRKLSDVLLRCRKTLVRHLEECKPLLKPLRQACRKPDEEALVDALLQANRAAPELRRYMRTDIRRAEVLRRRMLHAAREAQRLLDCADWREIAHFLEVNGELLSEKVVLTLMQQRKLLLVEDHGRSIDRTSQLASSNGVMRGKEGDAKCRSSASGARLLETERDEEDSRRTLVDEEHSQRVLCLKSVMDALAMLLFRADDKVSRASTGCHSVNTLPSSTTTDGDRHTPWMGGEATPDVSPIKRNSLPDSALKTEQQLDAACTSSFQAVGEDCSSNYTVVRDTASFSLPPPPPKQLKVVSPETWASLRALMREETIRRRDAEGTENFERSVFLLPMAARSALLTRLLPRRSLRRGQ